MDGDGEHVDYASTNKISNAWDNTMRNTLRLTIMRLSRRNHRKLRIPNHTGEDGNATAGATPATTIQADTATMRHPHKRQTYNGNRQSTDPRHYTHRGTKKKKQQHEQKDDRRTTVALHLIKQSNKQQPEKESTQSKNVREKKTEHH